MKSSDEYVQLAAEAMSNADQAHGPAVVQQEVRAQFYAELALIATLKELFGHGS